MSRHNIMGVFDPTTSKITALNGGPGTPDTPIADPDKLRPFFAASSYGVKRFGNATPQTATPANMIPADVVIPAGVLDVGDVVEIYWEMSHTTATGNFDPATYLTLASYPSGLGTDAVRIQPGGAATLRAGSGLLRYVIDGPASQHMLANPANLGDTGNPSAKTTWDVLSNGLNINIVSEFPANAPATEMVGLDFYSVKILKA